MNKNYYSLEDCKKNCSEYIRQNRSTVSRFEIDKICETMYNNNKDRYPPPDEWLDYYNVRLLNLIIEFPRIKRKRTFIKKNIL